ncbi:MAG: hypothetical protein PW789_18905 [Edaphobacter sp.]|uniref:hypothetical protein n=1 Tax=Edaphobacter sp. TaxID=1934404 RepID=UPI002383BE97|nr:hypothetical protein [Edaphobacter sp.]MDE1178649.1 hypothetical protein [Edaphobacter sp.]
MQTRTVVPSLRFGLILVAQLWLAHAMGYLVHEYAHTVVAWVLGHKANPLALDYGHLDAVNLLIQAEIDENVDYAPIFAAGKGAHAALIAVAGVLFGNGLCYLLSRRLYGRFLAQGRRWLTLFFFLLCLMNVGNFIAYVPCRTFTTHADMATVAKGLNISPWWIAMVMGLPFCVAVWHFLAKITPEAVRFIAPESQRTQIGLALLAVFMIFRFYGSSGIRNYGEASHWISFAFMNVLAPLSLLLCWPRQQGIDAAPR